MKIFIILLINIILIINFNNCRVREETWWNLCRKGYDPSFIPQTLAAAPEILDEKEEGTEQSCLMAACLNGNTKVIAEILKHGADPTIAEMQGYTCFHGVAFQGRIDATKFLIDYFKKNPNRKNNIIKPCTKHSDGFADFHRTIWGTEKRHASTLKIFLEYGGCSANDKPENGVPLLKMALQRKNKYIIRVLVEHDASFSELDKAEREEVRQIYEEVAHKKLHLNEMDAANHIDLSEMTEEDRELYHHIKHSLPEHDVEDL